MIAMLRRAYDSFRGSGDYSITVPPMDGALRPNNDIEQADLVASAPDADNVVLRNADVLFSSGDTILRLDGDGALHALRQLPARVSAMAVSGDAVAAGLSSGGIEVIGGPHDGRSFPVSTALPVNCPTALCFQDADTLLIANGSSLNGPERWKHDLMQKNAKGSILRLDLRSGGATRLAEGLAYPTGLFMLDDGWLLVSEAWRYRLVRVAEGRAPEAVLADLPAYPGRLSPTASGEGAWLALFAPRRRLVEHVLRETAYRRRMMAEIPSDYWIAPRLKPMSSFLEPLQGGTLKRLARLKPWAPSSSYGLIVRLDHQFQPVASFHSRADGTRHGIASCAAFGDRLLAACAGGDVLVSIDCRGL